MLARTAIQHLLKRLGDTVELELLRTHAADVRERALDGPDDLGERDLVGRAGQPVAALRAALARDEPVVAELQEDVLQELQRDRLRLRDALALDRPRVGARQFGRGAERVIDLGGDPTPPFSTKSIGAVNSSRRAWREHWAGEPRPCPRRPRPGSDPGHGLVAAAARPRIARGGLGPSPWANRTASPGLGEDVAEDARHLVELRLARDERRRDLDHRVAAVVGAADAARARTAVREEPAQELLALLVVNVSRVSLSFTSSIA